jgi:hypothetical protein
MAEKIKIDINKMVALRLIKSSPEIKISVEKPIKIELILRRGLSGEYFISDHPLIDIVLMPQKNKIVTFAKRLPKYDPYIAQDKFFDFLMRKGVIVPDTVQGGNVLGSMEAVYPINNDVDTIQALLLLTYLFIKEEIPLYQHIDAFEQEFDDELLDPDPQNSTELGEVPQDPRKGSIDPAMKPYGLIYRI